MDNLSILSEAKKEYTDQLSAIIAPVMIDVFDQMFQEAGKLSNNRKVLQMFQKLLKEVPNWSNAMSKQHTDRIVNKCSWFNDLLAAVFVSHVKILSSVRIQSGNKKLSLKLPTNEVFIQTVYNNAAKELYNDPYVFNEAQSEYARDKELYIRFSRVIEMTIKELIPVQHILQTYMNQTDLNEDKEFDVDETEPVDDDDIDQATEETPDENPDEELKEVPDVPVPTEAPEHSAFNDAPEPEYQQQSGLSPEFPVSSAPSSVPYDTEVGAGPQPDVRAPEDDSLFDDAPEQRTKKLRYM